MAKDWNENWTYILSSHDYVLFIVKPAQYLETFGTDWALIFKFNL